MTKREQAVDRLRIRVLTCIAFFIGFNIAPYEHWYQNIPLDLLIATIPFIVLEWICFNDC